MLEAAIWIALAGVVLMALGEKPSATLVKIGQLCWLVFAVLINLIAWMEWSPQAAITIGLSTGIIGSLARLIAKNWEAPSGAAQGERK